jgi:hypothetical protein
LRRAALWGFAWGLDLLASLRDLLLLDMPGLMPAITVQRTTGLATSMAVEGSVQLLAAL